MSHEKEFSTEHSSFLDRRSKKRLALGGAIASTLLTGGLLVGCAPGESKAPEPSAEPTIDAPAVPGEPSEPTPVETEVTTPEVSPEELRISADLPPEQLTEAFSDLMTDWMFADATTETIEATNEKVYELVQNGSSYKEATLTLANENADYYSKAAFADGWQNSPDMNAYKDYLVEFNADAIEVQLGRYGRGEPLIKWSTNITTVEELPTEDGTRLVKSFQETTQLNTDTEPEKSILSRTFDVSDGTARLIQQKSDTNGSY